MKPVEDLNGELWKYILKYVKKIPNNTVVDMIGQLIYINNKTRKRVSTLIYDALPYNNAKKAF